MKRRLFIILLVCGLLLTVGTTPGAAQEKDYSADRFDVDVVVQDDGSLRVTETIVYRFVGEPFTQVFRELPTEHTDGIRDITARVDGQVFPAGSNAGQVEISGDDPIRIVWHFEPTVDTTRTFELSYRMLRVVRQTDAADVLRYQPLPDEYGFPIASSTVRITYPGDATLAAEPEIQAGDAGVSTGEGQVTLTAHDLEPGTPLVVRLDFAPGSLISTPPEWQAQEQARDAWAPVWIVLAVLVAAGGVAAVVSYYRRYQPDTSAPAGRIQEPPDDMAPGMAGAINGSNASPAWTNALGTLFDLAQRGVLRIEQETEDKWYRSPDFVIEQVDDPAGLDPHERGLLNLLFEDKKGHTGSVKLSDLSGRISSSQWEKYEEPLKEEMKKAGLLSKARKDARRTLNVTGGVLFGLSLLSLPLVLIFNEQIGLWPLAVSFAVLLVSIVGLSLGMSLKPLSDQGAEVASRWQGFYEYLKDVTKGKAAATRPDMFDLYLPYAATYGLLTDWAKHFEEKGWTDLPPWFNALATSGTESMGAFVAMTAAASTSGGSAAGAGAAGAAGAGAAGGGAAGAS